MHLWNNFLHVRDDVNRPRIIHGSFMIHLCGILTCFNGAYKSVIVFNLSAKSLNASLTSISFRCTKSAYSVAEEILWTVSCVHFLCAYVSDSQDFSLVSLCESEQKTVSVALLCVIGVSLVIVGTNAFVNTEYNTFVVGICVSVLRKSKFKSPPIIIFWLLESLDRIVSYRSNDKAELLFGMRYISPTIVFLTVLTVSINIDSNLPSSNIARSSRGLNCIESFI